MAPGEGGLSFPWDDVICGGHVLGDELQQTQRDQSQWAGPLDCRLAAALVGR